MSSLKKGSTNGNGNGRSNEAQNELVEEIQISDELPKKFLPTLPTELKSHVGKTVKIESEKPQDIIECVGDYLGITDYKNNMVSFWFLDTIALQVLSHRGSLDDYYTSVLISWLAGEMKLIQDKKLCREDFMEEMKEIFHTAGEEVSRNDRLTYWDEIVRKNTVEETGVESGEEKLGNRRSSILKEFKRRGSRKSSQRKRSRESKIRVSMKEDTVDVKKEILPVVEENPQLSTINPLCALDIVIESTYDMYANELRYALVYAVFVEPIEMEIYRSPFLFRTPRPMKVVEVKNGPFDAQLQRKLKEYSPGQVSDKGTEKKIKGKSAKKSAWNSKVPTTPPPSLSDEELMIDKRRFILPLIEANEASRVFEIRDGDA